MAKVEAIKRTINQRFELVNSYKEDREQDAQSNDDDTVNDDDNDMGYESENFGQPWKSYEDEIYITNKELELVLRIFFEENIVWDFSYLKTWFN